VACVLGFALTASPALAPAHPHDDESSSDTKARKEIRVYRDGEDVYIDRGDKVEGTAPAGGYLGVRVQDITRELQKAKELPSTDGALISRVESDSPASEAGMKKGDVVLEVNHHQVTESSELISRIRDLEPGAKVPVVVLRDGTRKTLTVTIGERPKQFTYVFPRRGRSWNWTGLADGELPEIHELGPQLDRIRVYREDVQRQLEDIQRQLTRLRETELQRLEDEIRELRNELRARDQERAPRPD
jgi:membrane-associated protease RseP (regulator of RpoE activity)